jgi:phospho-N-acetylmuramoyl-pentapeptide-transferase
MIILLVVTIGNGLIGFLDDFIKVVLKRPLGLKAREKILGQVIIAALLAWYTVFVLEQGTSVILPLFGDLLDLGLLYFPFVILVVVATTNTVNLTDGLDGLAAGITFFVAVGLILLTGLLNVTEAAIFSGALAGACLSFLKYNSYPAKIFMGDTGSLALGGAVAAIAVVSKLELFLPLIGGIFVFEGLSVIIQVISFKLTGKRVFRMSPLHHHFELGGWPERKVVRFFWFGSVVMVLLGVFSFR